MFGSFLPSLWSSINHSLLGSRSRHCYAIMSGKGCVYQGLRLALRPSIDRIKKKVASAPKHSMAIAMSEADEKAGALARYFQARPAKASPKHPDVRKMALCAWSA